MKYKGVLAGLGNPGREYEGTRHNCGFMLVKELLCLAADTGSIRELNGKKFFSLLWEINLPFLKGPWLCAMPQTFMNDSGKAIKPLLAWHDIGPNQLIVAHDELDIPAGELRFKFGGGAAGHNGIISICQYLDSPDFYRLRIGTGKPAVREEVIKWVLNRPAPADREKIAKALEQCPELLAVFAEKGPEAAAHFARSVEKQQL